MRMMELIYRRADEFDVLHFHTDYFPLSLFSRQRTPFLTTLHGRLDIPEFKDVYELFDAPFVSISDSQRRPIPRLNWIRTVHHGMPADLLTPQPVKQDYLAFLGRISPEKGVDKAIRIAGAAGMKLKIAAKVDNADKEYYDSEIKPLIDASPWVEFIGEINDAQKPEFLSGAHALLFPIDWPEPFGLVMIESMACGTPVIAFNRGSVPEVIDDGVTGFIVHDEATRDRRGRPAGRAGPHPGPPAVRAPLHRPAHGGGLSRPLRGAVHAAGAEAARRRGLTPRHADDRMGAGQPVCPALRLFGSRGSEVSAGR